MLSLRRSEMARVFKTVFVLTVFFSMQSNMQSLAAELETQSSASYGVWNSSLLKNTNGNRLLCATETRDGDTILRINSYKDTADTFLELYNPKWTMMEGNVRFFIDFEIKGENYKAEIAGKSWGDSYTHDFTDVKNYELILGLLAMAKTFNVQNSNGTIIGRFSGIGSLEALQTYHSCVTKD